MTPRRLVASMLLLLVVAARPASALPAFAQQTGQPCTACHIGGFGPQLTPFGRAFKIGGYTQTGGEGLAAHIPLSAMVLGSFTNTGAAQPTPPVDHFSRNNNFALDQISVFLAGRINDYAGGFVQGTYSGTSPSVSLDNTDLRATAPFELGHSELRLGISVNNAPAVQDPYNSTPVWMFPFASSALAPTPTALPILDGGLEHNALGVTAYAWYDRHLYLEAGAYGTFGPTLLRATGATLGPGATANLAPYLRIAYEWDWAAQSAHLGALLLHANFNPAVSAISADGSAGRNHYTDYGLDAGYQFLGSGRHIVTADASFTHETQRLQAGFNTGGASQVDNTLNQLRANLTYFYENTYGLTVGWQSIWGSANPLLFVPAPVSGSRNGKPTSDALTVEADWIPFGKPDSWARPFANLRIGIQYTAYTRFNGSGRNYDGFGRSASDNNTLFLYLWMVF